jgi:hypothetical protein
LAFCRASIALCCACSEPASIPAATVDIASREIMVKLLSREAKTHRPEQFGATKPGQPLAPE